MKKHLLLFALACAASPLAAQITLSSSSVGAVGSAYYLGVDTILDPSYDIGQPGTNVTWNFAQLGQDYYDTIYFYDPATTPNGADFPSADLAVNRASDPSAYAYFEVNPSDFILLGAAADPLGMSMPIVAYQDPPSRAAIFPWTYLSVHDDTSTFSVRIDGSFLGFPGVDSVEFISHAIRHLNCDSWGNITLWGNAYAALRTREITTTHDMVNARFLGSWTNFQDTTYTDSTFSWMNDTKGYTLAEAIYEGGRLVRIEYQDANPVSRHNAADAQVIVYPNPAQGAFTVIDGAAALQTIRLYTLTGALVLETPTQGQQTRISLQNLAPGMYLMQGFDSQGANITTRKIAVK